MKLATCMFICCAIGIVHSKPSDVGTDERFDALLIRIDQLEERDRLQQVEIEKLRNDHETEIAMIRHEHKMELATLRHDQQTDLDELRHDLSRQTIRTNELEAAIQRQNDASKELNELEATVQRQNDESKELVNLSDDASTSEEQDGRINVAESTDTSRQQRDEDQKYSIPEHREQSAISKNRIRRVGNEVDIAFFATLSADKHHIGTNQDIAFDHVFTNIGNSYNLQFGVFVAPMAGTYVFSVTISTANIDRARYGIFRNFEQITTLSVNGVENPYQGTSQTVIIHLAKGDDVSVKHTDSDHVLVGNNRCMFSGFLLSQDFTDSSPIVGK